MSHGLTPKQRDAALQQWRSLIMRECRDLNSLERVRARVLQDRDVQADAELRSVVQAELGRRQADLQREQQSEPRGQSASPSPPPYTGSESGRDEAGRRTSRDVYTWCAPDARPALPHSIPPARDPDQAAFSALVQAVRESLASGDVEAARAAWDQMRTLHEKSGHLISASELQRYEQRIEKLRARLAEFRDRIDTMTRDALAAARHGDAEAAAKLMRRLSAIHVAHPRLLDEHGLAKIHRDIVGANEGREDSLTTRRLVERERAVAAKMTRLAAAVSAFHRIVCTVPESDAAFHRAETTYLHALQEDRLHEEDWLAEFVLELADVLAEWSVPPPGAEQQIDRFLEKVRVAIERVQKKMGEIDRERGGGKGSFPPS